MSDLSIKEMRKLLDENDNWEATFDKVIDNSPDLRPTEREEFIEEFERCAKLKDEGVAVTDWNIKWDDFKNGEFEDTTTPEDIWSAFCDYYENCH